MSLPHSATVCCHHHATARHDRGITPQLDHLITRPFSFYPAIIGVAWLRLAARGFKAADTTKWARQLFRFSLIVLLTFSLLISINAYVV